MDTQNSEFNEWVASIESEFAKSWVPVERYTRLVGAGERGYIYAVNGIVTRDYYVDSFTGKSHDITAPANSFVGKQTWGLKLQSVFGYRKLPAGLWVNTLTGEMSAIEPHELEMLRG